MKNYTYEMVQAEMAFKDLFGTKELIEARKYYFASESFKMDYIMFLKQETERKLKANECDKNMDKCLKCEYIKECTASDKASDCYGCYDDKGLECNNCKNKESCVEDTEKRKEEDNKKSCFGNYRDCYMCTHCIDCKKCREETIHREDVEEDDDFI